MPEETKSVVIRTRPGAPIVKNGEKQLDGDGKVKREEPIPVITVELKVLTSAEAMDADDFAQALSPVGSPSPDNRIRVFALCAIRKFNQEIILRPTQLQDVIDLRDRFEPDDLQKLGIAHLGFARKIEEEDDPLPSSGAKP